MRRHNNQNRVLVGAIIIVFGILALIDSLRIFDTFNILSFWPTMLILAGVLKIYQTRNRAGYVVGGILVAFGVFLTLEHMGYFHIRDWWPVLLIGAGVLVLSKGLLGNQASWCGKESSQSASSGFGTGEIIGASDAEGNTTASAIRSYVNVTAVMSGNKLQNNSQDFRGGEITAVMGGVEIDLRQASILADATISVFAMWGGIVIKVPADWSVVSHATPILGGIEDKSVPPAVSSKRLIIEGYVVMGGVEIKN